MTDRYIRFDDSFRTEEFIYYLDLSGRRWVKNVKVRNSGESLGQLDVYIVTPTGTQMRSIKELTEYIGANGYFDIDPMIVNFEKPDSMLPSQPTDTEPRILHKNTLGKIHIQSRKTRQNATKCLQCRISKIAAFIRFIESRGQEIPKYMFRRSVRRGQKRSYNNNTIKVENSKHLVDEKIEKTQRTSPIKMQFKVEPEEEIDEFDIPELEEIPSEEPEECDIPERVVPKEEEEEIEEDDIPELDD